MPAARRVPRSLPVFGKGRVAAGRVRMSDCDIMGMNVRRVAQTIVPILLRRVPRPSSAWAGLFRYHRLRVRKQTNLLPCPGDSSASRIPAGGPPIVFVGLTCIHKEGAPPFRVLCGGWEAKMSCRSYQAPKRTPDWALEQTAMRFSECPPLHRELREDREEDRGRLNVLLPAPHHQHP
jgi:hypothetical protein